MYDDLVLTKLLRQDRAIGVVRPNPRKFRQTGFQASTVWCSPHLLI
jgi:hypothetical protein